MAITLDSLLSALETLEGAGYPGNSELVLVPVQHNPNLPQMAIGVVDEDDEVALVPGTTLNVQED
jgi:hypothetical protein